MDRLFAASPLFPAPCFAPSPQLRHLADETAEALAGNSGQLEILLASLMAEIVTETSGLRRLKGQAGSIADFRIRRAIHELRACAVQGTGFDARQLARTAGLSRSHLFEMFKRETGLTPSLLHNALRMETAYGRLHEHQTAIQDIASGLGFSKAGHFTRFFASNFGINPRSYRRLVAAK
ncbi:MAG: AraC family transcriptional regulator [Rhodospirillales bacterium]|nr:MAG: AraC family transcriptional regulator [Rhodospirillales bacterium]